MNRNVLFMIILFSLSFIIIFWMIVFSDFNANKKTFKVNYDNSNTIIFNYLFDIKFALKGECYLDSDYINYLYRRRDSIWMGYLVCDKERVGRVEIKIGSKTYRERFGYMQQFGMYNNIFIRKEQNVFQLRVFNDEEEKTLFIDFQKKYDDMYFDIENSLSEFK